MHDLIDLHVCANTESRLLNNQDYREIVPGRYYTIDIVMHGTCQFYDRGQYEDLPLGHRIQVFRRLHTCFPAHPSKYDSLSVVFLHVPALKHPSDVCVAMGTYDNVFGNSPVNKNSDFVLF